MSMFTTIAEGSYDPDTDTVRMERGEARTYSKHPDALCTGVYACTGRNHCHCWWSTVTVTQDAHKLATCCCGTVESLDDRLPRGKR